MASRSFLPPLGSLEVDVVELFADITIGASGAVSSSTGKGFASIAKAATGQYTLTLSDSYNKLLGASLTLLDDTDSDPTTVGVLMRIQSEAVSNSTPTVVIQCSDTTDGSDANPADGAKIYVSLKLRNSSVS